jgi:hypothetical protein
MTVDHQIFVFRVTHRFMMKNIYARLQTNEQAERRQNTWTHSLKGVAESRDNILFVVFISFTGASVVFDFKPFSAHRCRFESGFFHVRKLSS